MSARRMWSWLIIHLWRKRQQAIDLQILWPTFCELADVEHARRGFRLYMDHDPAYGHMSETERNEYAAGLVKPK